MDATKKALALIETGVFTSTLSDSVGEASAPEKAQMIARAGLKEDHETLDEYRDALLGHRAEALPELLAVLPKERAGMKVVIAALNNMCSDYTSSQVSKALKVGHDLGLLLSDGLRVWVTDKGLLVGTSDE